MATESDMEEKRTESTARKPAAGEDQLEALLRLAGRRPTAADDVTRHAFEVTHREWHRVLDRRRSRRALGLTALLAAAALAAGVGLRGQRAVETEPGPRLPPPVAATVEGAGGALRLVPPSDEAEGLALGVGDTLTVGETLESGADSRAALRLANGSSLRLDRASRVRFETPTLVVLESGRLYVDSGLAASSPDPVSVRTELGLVQEIGTQFEVRVAPDGLRVRVREGIAALERGGAVYETHGGGELTMAEDGGVTRRRLPPYDDEWTWVVEVAPSFELEGSRLGDFLAWVGRETGRRVRFASTALERGSSDTVLHGSVEGLTPVQALQAVLPTCGLESRRVEGQIEIHRLEGGA